MVYNHFVATNSFNNSKCVHFGEMNQMKHVEKASGGFWVSQG
jgi:hypothetical protein